jgi:TolB protein
LLLLAVSGCGDAVQPETGPGEIVAIGRAERGSSLLLRMLTPAGDTLPAVRWSVEPSDAGTWSGDTLRLARTGRIEVVAVHEGVRRTRALVVAAPPEIVFDMAVGGNRDLYRAAIDGGGLARLTTHPGVDSDPATSGGTVVFVSDRDGNRELYALSLAGGAERRLTTTPADETQPALSPDGARLAFARGADLPRVLVSAPDGSGAARPDPAYGHGGTIENAPAWSPDGRTLVFMSTAGGNPDLYRWSGGPASLLHRSGGGEFEPAWSPDGTRIAFSSNRTGDAELFLLAVASGEVARLTDRAGSDGYPAWLADGRIVYVAFEGTTPTLRWLDPAAPAATHPIPLPGTPGNPAALPD